MAQRSINDLLPPEILLETLSYTFGTLKESSKLKLISRSFYSLVLFMTERLLKELEVKLPVSMNLSYLHISYDERDLLWSHFKYTFPLWRVHDNETLMLQVNRHIAKCLNAPKSAEQLDLALYFMILNRHYFRKLVESSTSTPDTEENRDLHLPIVQDAELIETVPITEVDLGMKELKLAFYDFVFKHFRDPKLYFFLRFLKSNRAALVMDISTMSKRILLDDSAPIPYPREIYFITLIRYRLRHFIEEHSSGVRDLLSARASFYHNWVESAFWFDFPVVFLMLFLAFQMTGFFDLLFRIGLSAITGIALANCCSPSFYAVCLIDDIYYCKS